LAGTLVAAGVLALGVSACGSDSGSSSSTSAAPAAAASGGDTGVAAATKAVTAASSIPKFTFAGEPFDMSKVKGKKIFSIPISSANPFVAAYDKAAKGLAEKYGATWTEYGSQGQPNQWAAGVSEAINQKADVLVLSGPDVSLLEGPLKRAKATGMKIVLGHILQNGVTVPDRFTSLVDGYMNAPFHEAARLESDYVTSQSKGKANVLIVTSNEVPPSKGIVSAMQEQYSKNCPDCKVSVVNVPAADWATKIAPEVQSALQKDPSIDWVVPIYDSMSIFGESGIRAAGKATSVKIASFNGTPEILNLIEKGDITQMDVGESTTWLGWAVWDVVGRVIAGAKLPAGGDEKLALRIFTDANVADTGTPPDGTKGYGDAFQAGYTKIWEGGT
jgi:ribose transport system substrate-binding protein